MVDHNLNYYLQIIPAITVKKIRKFEEKKKKEINSKWSHIFNNLRLITMNNYKLHLFMLKLLGY